MKGLYNWRAVISQQWQEVKQRGPLPTRFTDLSISSDAAHRQSAQGCTHFRSSVCYGKQYQKNSCTHRNDGSHIHTNTNKTTSGGKRNCEELKGMVVFVVQL